MALKVGFIGVGGIARRHLRARASRGYRHGRFLRRGAGARASAPRSSTVTPTRASLSSTTKRSLTPSSSTPPSRTVISRMSAKRRGIHFFVESPSPSTWRRRTASPGSSRPIITQVGYDTALPSQSRRCASSYPRVKHRHGRRTTTCPGFLSGWWPKMELGGGQLVEQATHMLDLGRFLAGEATVTGAPRACATGRRRRTISLVPAC